MDKIDFFVDNATQNSGYTPISIPLFDKVVIIKLHICPDDCAERIAYQFAHELTHIVFYAYYGIDKPRADEREESICSAASLIMIKELYPSSLERWVKHVKGLSEQQYRDGYKVATEAEYSLERLKEIIQAYKANV